MAGRRRRQRSGLEQLRRGLYFAERDLGDLEAAQRGTLGRRLIRRRLARSIFRSMRDFSR